MLLYVLNVFSVVLFGLSSASETTLFTTTCKRDSVDSACLKHAFKEVWPRLVKGIPELDIPPFDPLVYNYGVAVFDSGAIHAKVILSNVTASGLDKTSFNDIRPHFLDDSFHLEIDAPTPIIFIKGTVKMNGTLGIFRIADEGPFNVTAYDVITSWNLTGHIVNDTWIVEHVRMLPTVKKLKVYFDNFFQGNKELNDIAVTFVNEFWPPLYRVMLPIVSDAWDPWLTDLWNRVFSKVSFSKLFS